MKFTKLFLTIVVVILIQSVGSSQFVAVFEKDMELQKFIEVNEDGTKAKAYTLNEKKETAKWGYVDATIDKSAKKELESFVKNRKIKSTEAFYITKSDVKIKG